MAFINCGECGRRIVDKRKVCPKCGTNFKELEKKKRWQKNEAVFKATGKINPADKTWIRCPNCDYQGETGKVLRGNGWIELVLYLFYIVPGIIYSIWRRSGDGLVCPACTNPYVVKTEPIYDGETADGKVVPIKRTVTQ